MNIAGFDEVGRGCIAGSVVAAAVILPAHAPWLGELKDSKRITPKKREQLAEIIRRESIAWAVGRAEVDEIYRLNILEASMLAMSRAYLGLSVKPDKGVVDGNRYPAIDCPGEAIIGGDASVPEISAASIIAKVYRDNEMTIMDQLFPGYGMAIHKGYPTRLHLSRLARLGISPVHRLGYKPVQAMLASSLGTPLDPQRPLK